MRPATVGLVLVLAGCAPSNPPNTTDGTASGSTAITQEGWVEVAPDPVPRSEHPAAWFEGEMVVSGGFVESGFGDDAVTDTVGAYDPDSDAWRELPGLPAPRHHGMAAVVDGRLFVIGGYSLSGFSPTSAVWELVDGGWVDRAPIPVLVGAGAAVALDGFIYLVGGTPHGSLFRYDPETDTWEHLADPRLQREHLAAVALDGELWALAGRWEGEIFDSVEIFDPSAAVWRDGPTMNDPRSGFGAVVIGGSILAAGGEVFEPDVALDSVELMSDGEWSLADPLPYGIHGHPLVAVENVVYLLGGSTQAAGVENDGRTYRMPIG